MSIPKYVSLGSWLFKVKEVVVSTKNTTIVTLVGNIGQVTIGKKMRASCGKIKGRAYNRKPRCWW